nr:MAG TPA: hypothetical protein [Caudoviricetes sp.]DAX37381.1 MAG TPA: hypothetical protein [Caudoviricetes sp.]
MILFHCSYMRSEKSQSMAGRENEYNTFGK